MKNGDGGDDVHYDARVFSYSLLQIVVKNLNDKFLF